MNPAYRTAGNTKMQSAISNDMLNEIHRLWKSAIDKITDKSRVGYVSEEDKVELYAAFHARHKDNHEPTKEVKDDRTVEAMKEYAECVGMHSANPEMMAQCFNGLLTRGHIYARLQPYMHLTEEDCLAIRHFAPKLRVGNFLSGSKSRYRQQDLDRDIEAAAKQVFRYEAFQTQVLTAVLARHQGLSPKSYSSSTEFHEALLTYIHQAPIRLILNKYYDMKLSQFLGGELTRRKMAFNEIANEIAMEQSLKRRAYQGAFQKKGQWEGNVRSQMRRPPATPAPAPLPFHLREKQPMDTAGDKLYDTTARHPNDVDHARTSRR